MKHLNKYVILLLFLGIIPLTAQSQQNDLLNGEYWKAQGLTDVMPAWIENGIDSTDGQFYAFMDREWNPYKNELKYPGMMSRHLFSYSVAYMLSGKEEYLQRADRLFYYLIEHGWDEQYGGWHYAINPKGKAVDSKKDLFMNIYATTGLAMYYMVTHKREAMRYIQKSRKLLEKHAWDQKHSGYYKTLNRRWSVTDSRKVFTPQVAPASGYLLYLYAATQNEQYLDKTENLMELVEQRLLDEKTGWIREKFNAQWNSTAENREEEQIDIGHNIEVSWMWMRLYGITGNAEYREKALALYEKLHQHAFHPSGAWMHKMNLTDPKVHPETTPWWIQAYGNMMQLPTYYYGEVSESLDRFQKGSEFWNKAFLDEKYGATVLSATLDGEIDRGDKAVRSKTSYHAMELAMLNYLYLNLFINNEPVTLYFHQDKESDDEPLCPLPIYDEDAKITEATAGGKSLEISDPARPCIDLSADANSNIKITIQ